MRRVRSVRGSRLHVLHTKLTARAFRLDLFQTLTRRVDANGVRAALIGVQKWLEGFRGNSRTSRIIALSRAHVEHPSSGCMVQKGIASAWIRDSFACAVWYSRFRLKSSAGMTC